MYEKKNKLSKPAPILLEISFRLLDAVYRNINEKMSHFSLKHSFLMGVSENIDFICTFATISDAAFTF